MADSTTTVHEVFKLYLQRKLGSSTAKTEQQYLRAVTLLSQHLDRDALVEDLMTDKLLALKERRLQKVTAKTSRNEMTLLMALAKFAHSLGLLEHVPKVRNSALRCYQQTTPAWSGDELGQLIDACDQLESYYFDTGAKWILPKSGYWKALVCVLWDTGHPIDSVVELKFKDLQALKLRAQTRKFTEALREGWKTAKTNRPVFPWGLKNAQRWAHLSSLLKGCKLVNASRSQLNHARTPGVKQEVRHAQ